MKLIQEFSFSSKRFSRVGLLIFLEDEYSSYKCVITGRSHN